MENKTFNIKALLFLGTILLLAQCATVPVQPPPRPLDDRAVEAVIKNLQEQEERVTSFYSFGNLFVSKGFLESETLFLTMGLKDPFKIKIELTHTWGAPLLHILIRGARLHVLSFQDKKYYVGPLTPKTLSRFLPWFLEQDLIWSTLRGYPKVRDYKSRTSPGENRIILLNDDGRSVEEIELSPAGNVPTRVYLPENGLTLTFADYHDKGGISYAHEVGVYHNKNKNRLRWENMKMVFNRALSEDLFRFEIPRTFTPYQFQAERKGHSSHE